MPHICTGQSRLGENMHFDHLTILEGLSHNTVHCLLQDHHGYIWIGTQNGLNKYDGYSFEIYSSNGSGPDESGFTGKNISVVFEDSDQNLWVGTRKQGINVKWNSTDNFVNLNVDTAFAGIQGFEITCFHEDEVGNLWVGTEGAGILTYDPKTGSSRHYTQENSGLRSELIFDLKQDKRGTIWVVTPGEGIQYLKPNGLFGYKQVTSPGIPNLVGFRKQLFLDDDDLWVGTEGSGLYRIRLSDWHISYFSEGTGRKFLSSNAVRDVVGSRSGKIYICTDGGGLNVYDPQRDEIDKYFHIAGKSDELNTNAILCAIEDRTNNLWIGSYNGGINIHKAGKTWFDFFTPVSGDEDELSHRSILSIIQDSKGIVWAGTDGGGLNWLQQDNDRYNFRALKHDPADPASIGGNVVKTIFEDSDENLWIGIWGVGLDKYNPSTRIFTHYTNQPDNEHSLSGTNVWSIAERKDGTLWIGTIGNGLTVYHPQTGRFVNYNYDPQNQMGISDNRIMVVFVDQQDRVWIGTADNGLNLWDDRTEQFMHYTHKPDDSLSLNSNEIRAIFQDSRGQLWIGTEGGGLNLWKKGAQFSHIDERDGLIDNNVMGITEDMNGMIWISTFKGVSRLDPESMKIRNFHLRSGQNSNQFNQMSILTASDGKLFFGGIYGLNAIHPHQVADIPVESPIIFTDLKVYNKSVRAAAPIDGRIVLEQPIEEAREVYLTYPQKSFTLSFATTDYTDPDNTEFAYKMEGFDSDWLFTDPGQNSVTYTNLDPGDYTFRVRLEDVQSDLSIYIKPPLWQLWWFRLLLSLIALGLLSGLVYIYLKRKEGIHKQQLLKAQSEILQLQNEKLETEISTKNSKLLFTAGQMAHKNEILTNIKKELTGLDNKQDTKIRKLMRLLDRELKSEDYWKDFNLYFDQIDQNFIQSILKKHPDLTQNDLRICSLMRINLSTKEIASLLNVSVRGVEQSRYRLKKRLDLGNDEDLSRYILNFDVRE